MNESDRREFKRLLDRVGAYYEHPIQNPATWWDALKPNPIERVAQAFDAWIRSEEGKYPPKPAIAFQKNNYMVTVGKPFTQGWPEPVISSSRE